MTTTKEVLVKARALVEKGWTKDAYARDSSGDRVPYYDFTACQWCMVGAVDAADDIRLRFSAKDILRRVIGGQISAFNDAPSTTHADVLAAFDRAIAECEK